MDIVERLAKYSKDWRERAASFGVVVEAADTITALRARCASLEAERDEWKRAADEWTKAAIEQQKKVTRAALRGFEKGEA